MPDLTVKLFAKTFHNPLLPASGCYANCQEAAAWYDLAATWGGLISKSVSHEPRKGNPGIRIAEAPAGLLNSIGLQNPGIEHFMSHELPWLLEHHDNVIVNIAGSSTEEYIELVKRLNDEPIAAIEVNLSCPNVSEGCMSIGTDPEQVTYLMKLLSELTDVPLIAKLTPNVTDIRAIARACEAGGAAAISLVNTFLGMAIDLKTRRPYFRRNTAGYSGPGIKPIALRLAAEACQAVDIPVIGIGGIATGQDVLEYVCAGCCLVEIGASILRDPYAVTRIEGEMKALMEELGIQNLTELRGSLQWYEA